MSPYREIEARTILRRHGIVDPWFVGRHGMNLYRGCEHGCLYCDGRAERYYVQGDFARDILVKTNAAQLLTRELGRLVEPGFVFLGGGVSDSYQPAESHYRLARQALELLLAHCLPVHVLTKSALVERDLDLLAAINQKSRAILSFSIQTTDETVSERFEPNAAPLPERWRILERARALGVPTGVMAMPLLPGISDQPEAIAALVARAREAGAAFVLAGGLTLRPGAQQQCYLAAIARHVPEHLDGYRKLYRRQQRSGAPDPRYLHRLNQRVADALDQHGVFGRIPHRLFVGLMPLYREVAVRLEHRAFTRGETDPAHRDLMRGSAAIQRWATELLKRRKGRPALTYAGVEARFCSLAAEDSALQREIGGSGRIAPDLRELLADALERNPRLEAPPELIS